MIAEFTTLQWFWIALVASLGFSVERIARSWFAFEKEEWRTNQKRSEEYVESLQGVISEQLDEIKRLRGKPFEYNIGSGLPLETGKKQFAAACDEILRYGPVVKPTPFMTIAGHEFREPVFRMVETTHVMHPVVKIELATGSIDATITLKDRVSGPSSMIFGVIQAVDQAMDKQRRAEKTIKPVAGQTGEDAFDPRESERLRTWNYLPGTTIFAVAGVDLAVGDVVRPNVAGWAYKTGVYTITAKAVVVAKAEQGHAVSIKIL